MSFVGEGDKLKLSTWLMEDGQGRVQDLSSAGSSETHSPVKQQSNSQQQTWTYSSLPLPAMQQEVPLPVLEPTFRPSEPVYNFPIRL